MKLLLSVLLLMGSAAFAGDEIIELGELYKEGSELSHEEAEPIRKAVLLEVAKMKHPYCWVDNNNAISFKKFLSGEVFGYQQGQSNRKWYLLDGVEPLFVSIVRIKERTDTNYDYVSMEISTNESSTELTHIRVLVYKQIASQVNDGTIREPVLRDAVVLKEKWDLECYSKP